VFRSAPFREPQDPAAFAAWAFTDEEPGGDVRFAEPVILGDDRAAVEYWAVVRDLEGAQTTIAGVALLRFDADGLVVEERDYWSEAEGPHTPHGAWGT
jgi:hypothetical protein